MAIRIGANPIGWSNDDLRELGGETPLETCLAEAKEAGFEGMELGHKFPREPTGAAAVLGRFGLDLRLRLVFGRAAAPRRRGGDRGSCGRISPCSRRWAATCWSSPRPRTPSTATARSRSSSGRSSGRATGRSSAARMTAVADAYARRGRAARLPPSHGHGGRDARPTSTPHGRDRRRRCICCSTPATRPSPAPTRRRSPAAIATASRMSTPRTCAPAVMARGARPRDSSFLDAVIDGVFTVPGDGCVDYPGGASRELPGYKGWARVEAEQDPEEGATRSPMPSDGHTPPASKLLRQAAVASSASDDLRMSTASLPASSKPRQPRRAAASIR